MTEKEAEELFQFVLNGAVKKMIHCMVAEGNKEDEIIDAVGRIQEKYKNVYTPKGVLMSYSEETLREFVKACQDHHEKALENNPSIAHSICKRTDYNH